MEVVKRTLGEICDEGGGEIRTGPFGAQLHQSDYKDKLWELGTFGDSGTYGTSRTYGVYGLSGFLAFWLSGFLGEMAYENPVLYYIGRMRRMRRIGPIKD